MQGWLEMAIRRHARGILVGFALLTGAAGTLASGITIDGSVEHLMMSDDPARERDRVAKEIFGNDEVLMLALELGAPYTESDLRKLSQLSAELESIPGVERIKSLANTEDIRGTEDELDASPLVDLDGLREDFARVQERTRDHRLYRDLLVSEAQDVFGVLVYAENAEANSEAMNALTSSVLARVDEMAPPWRAHYAGYPVTAFEVNRIVKRDLALLTPLALLAVGVVLYAFTRRLFPVGLMLALIVWVEAVAHAWLALWGIPLNVVVSILPTVLVATSTTYVIYAVGILARVSLVKEPGVALVRLLTRPVLLSGISTGIGFGSLRLIDVQAVGDLGGALAAGMLAAMVGGLLLLPALVQVFGLRLELRQHHAMEELALVGVRLARRPWRILGVGALLVGLAIPGLLRIRLHTDTLDYFSSQSFVRTGADFFEQHLSSAFLMKFVLSTDEPGGVLEPEVLAFASRVAEELEPLPQVDRTVSMLDYFYLMDAALRPEREPSSNPGSREAAAQYLLLYESSGSPEDYDRYIDFERSALSLIASAHGGSSRYVEAAERVEALAAEAPEGLRVESLGSMYLYSRAMESLTRGMLLGLAVAAVLVGLVMVVGLGSFGLSAVAAIPNLAPLLLAGGALGWLGIPLSMSTSLVGCLALGLAVDDTAHVMGHLRRGEALEKVYRTVGPAVLLTTLALGIGFCALAFSEFQTVRVLGIATSGTLVVALAADLLLLPSLLCLLGFQPLEKEPSGERRRRGIRAGSRRAARSAP